MDVCIFNNKWCKQYQRLVPVESKHWGVFRQFNGIPINAPWPHINIQASTNSEDLPTSDFPMLSPHVPVFSQRVVETLGDLLKENGEFFPLEYNKSIYFAYNITHLIDALDMRQSEFTHLHYNNRGLCISRHKFHADKLSDATIFKLPRLSSVFVTDTFIQRVLETDLVGFNFTPI